MWRKFWNLMQSLNMNNIYSIFLKHWNCQLLVQNMLGHRKWIRNGYFTRAWPANKNDIFTIKIKWHWSEIILDCQRKTLILPKMLLNYIFWFSKKNAGERKGKKMEEDVIKMDCTASCDPNISREWCDLFGRTFIASYR